MLGLGIWEVAVAAFVAVALLRPKDLLFFFRTIRRVCRQIAEVSRSWLDKDQGVSGGHDQIKPFGNQQELEKEE